MSIPHTLKTEPEVTFGELRLGQSFIQNDALWVKADFKSNTNAISLTHIAALDAYLFPDSTGVLPVKITHIQLEKLQAKEPSPAVVASVEPKKDTV